MSLAKNLALILEKVKIACLKTNRDPKKVKIVWVTKTISQERVEKFLNLLKINRPQEKIIIGENKVQELSSKIPALVSENLESHFIGHLQTNKVKEVLPLIQCLHSLDRFSLAIKIQNFLEKTSSPPLNVFIQVNISGEESKFGLKKNELLSFLEEIKTFNKIRVIGLMTMAPFSQNKELVRACFKELKVLTKTNSLIRLTNSNSHGLMSFKKISMGMSNDFEIALEEGATHIRIGRSLFGERDPKKGKYIERLG